MSHFRLFAALSVLSLTACAGGDSETEAAFSASGQIIAMSGGEGGARNACFTCHGLDGMGDGDAVPRLAGLDAGYLQKQMQDYAEDIRHDPVMTPIAQGLDDDGRRAVALWYADMTPPEAPPPPLLPAPSVYLRGDPSRGITACTACHGAAGQGRGAGNPEIAGQPRVYTLEQLRRWKAADRRNDPRGVMLAAVAKLTDAEMIQIADWLEWQSPARPPDTAGPAASVAAAAAAEPAASRGTRRPDR